MNTNLILDVFEEIIIEGSQVTRYSNSDQHGIVIEIINLLKPIVVVKWNDDPLDEHFSTYCDGKSQKGDFIYICKNLEVV